MGSAYRKVASHKWASCFRTSEALVIDTCLQKDFSAPSLSNPTPARYSLPISLADTRRGLSFSIFPPRRKQEHAPRRS